MSDQHGNPFVLPGLGQHSDLSGNPLLASMEMMRQAWAGLTGPGGLASSLPMAPPMNVEDLAPHRRAALGRKLVAHEPVHAQQHHPGHGSAALHHQHAARLRRQRGQHGPGRLARQRRGLAAGSGAGPETGAGQGQGGRAVRRRGQGRRQRSGSGSRRRRCPGGGSRPGRRAALCRHERTDGRRGAVGVKAWWDLLQQQFGQIAAATAATMPAAAPSKVESEADKPAPKAAKTEAKPAAGAGQAGLEGRRPRQARRPQGSA